MSEILKACVAQDIFELFISPASDTQLAKARRGWLVSQSFPVFSKVAERNRFWFLSQKSARLEPLPGIKSFQIQRHFSNLFTLHVTGTYDHAHPNYGSGSGFNYILAGKSVGDLGGCCLLVSTEGRAGLYKIEDVSDITLILSPNHPTEFSAKIKIRSSGARDVRELSSSSTAVVQAYVSNAVLQDIEFLWRFGDAYGKSLLEHWYCGGRGVGRTHAHLRRAVDFAFGGKNVAIYAPANRIMELFDRVGSDVVAEVEKLKSRNDRAEVQTFRSIGKISVEFSVGPPANIYFLGQPDRFKGRRFDLVLVSGPCQLLLEPDFAAVQHSLTEGGKLEFDLDPR